MDSPVHTYFEDLAVGQTASMGKTITEADILLFAGVSGDTNPAHMDEEYAATTLFKGRIAHGMLSGAVISALFGTRFPGPGSIYVSQSLTFKAPVRIGDTLRAHVELTALVPKKKFATFHTWGTVGGTVVVDGEATLMVPSRDADGAVKAPSRA
ncbi:MaoC family dehydratase [Roseospira marina]|uniref:MaoC family dehydratase n=1 Tax=Roseospira marina TaxID=140057 RepID=A0A5M6IFP1_9PROT|nr:MaoC family dehydratase [Roseospira marina]KAA5606545.1 MaoC family dehydratase [Roseospira marina]MBB4314025.1 3-hydroxybutyryl-CoA dehydratase [Roseospira marina]MBB5087186.1 3-hydroxybutyryl-CoA dehydratase [Roseospira marina]